MKMKSHIVKLVDGGGSSCTPEIFEQTQRSNRGRPLAATYISACVEHQCAPINHVRKPVNHYFNKQAPSRAPHIHYIYTSDMDRRRLEGSVLTGGVRGTGFRIIEKSCPSLFPLYTSLSLSIFRKYNSINTHSAHPPVVSFHSYLLLRGLLVTVRRG